MITSEDDLRPAGHKIPISSPRAMAASGPLRDAVSRALGATGTTVTSAGLVLAGTFAVFALVGGRTRAAARSATSGWA